MREEKIYFVYILASDKNATLYVGITNDLQRRILEHKENKIKGFTEKYKVHNLVYYEEFGNVDEAIQREKRIKNWNRAWKLELIEKENSNWEDLYPKLFEDF
jgi:putative endonuclease